MPYIRAELTDAGDAFAVVRGHDAVVHAAAIPDPTSSPPHRVFQNNLMAIFNTLEAAGRSGAARFVNLSSETVPGFIFPERPWVPDYLPVDEQHPIRPQDPYASAKHFGEQPMDRAKARRLLGYDPQRSWRDYLHDSGHLRPEVRERLERGETGVQRGRRITGGD